MIESAASLRNTELKAPLRVYSEKGSEKNSEKIEAIMFFKRKKSKPETTPTPETSTEVEKSSLEDATSENSGTEAGNASPNSGGIDPSLQGDNTKEEDKKAAPLGVFARIKRGLSRTSQQLSEGLGNLLLGKKAIDEDLLEEIETLLLMADIGVEATTEIIDDLTQRVERKQLADTEALYGALKTSLKNLLNDAEAPLIIGDSKKPFVILVVGVNGVGKTTTIGKLAKRYQNEGKSVMLAAGDTFRAAAVEQLQVWGDRNNVPVVAQHTGADSASVIFDAVQSAQSKNIDVLIADTAGRLHNKSNLMDELSKVQRVMGKLDDTAPHETLLVLDAGTGQNALSQADQFREAADVSGLVLTKLDGTAKGGIIFALCKKHKIPVRFIGVGEGIDDLQPFSANNFTEALFGQEQAPN